MPTIGASRPVSVHFAIALLVLGVIFRWVSLAGRAPFTGPAAATVLILGAAAAVLAVHSGTDAHGPVERIPGVRQAVMDHEEAGAWGPNAFPLLGPPQIVPLLPQKRTADSPRPGPWGAGVGG